MALNCKFFNIPILGRLIKGRQFSTTHSLTRVSLWFWTFNFKYYRLTLRYLSLCMSPVFGAKSSSADSLCVRVLGFTKTRTFESAAHFRKPIIEAARPTFSQTNISIWSELMKAAAKTRTNEQTNGAVSRTRSWTSLGSGSKARS